MRYVTYNDTGDLTGGYLQNVLPAHEAAHIVVDADTLAQWVIYRANAARDGVELAPVAAYDLATDKLALNAEINTWRAAINYTTFPHAGKVIACDTLSRSDIDAVANHIALFGTFPASFPGAWKATDNTLIMQPTIGDFKAMFTSMTTQGTANFNQSQTWKTSMNSATTKAGLDAIRAEMGL